MNVNPVASSSCFYEKDEKDDKDLTHYGNSRVDNTLKIVLDSISYLSTSVRDSSQLTLIPEKAGVIFKLIKENKIDFFEIKNRVNTREDLVLVKKIAMCPDKYEELFTRQEEI